MIELGIAKLLAPALHVLSIKKMFMLALPSVLFVFALCTIDIDPSARHAVYTYLHINSPSTMVTVFVSIVWSMWRWRTRVPLVPFLFVYFGFLASMVPAFPAPWTYMAVVVIFWATLTFFLFRRPFNWLISTYKPRAS